MSGLAILRKLLLREAAKQSGERSGIAQIGNVTRDIAEKKFQAFVLGAKKQGVDLDNYTEEQLKYIIELNKPKGPRVISADSPEGRGITKALLGRKEGKVIEGKFGKPFAEEVDLRQKMIDDAIDNSSPGFSGDIKYDAQLVADDLAEKMYRKEFYDLSKRQQSDVYGKAYDGLAKQRFKGLKKPEPEDKAEGGRIGYKIGSIDKARRAFLKTVGTAGAGLAALKSGILGLGKEAAPTAEKVIEKVATSDVPPYFLNLVNKIKNLGKKFDGPKERSESFTYKDYEMDIDYDTGAIEIKKTREAMIPGSDEAGISEEVYMTYKPGMADETTKGKKVADEYEEFTARPDMDGKMKDVDEGVPDEVIEEGTIFEDNITEFGKASGGIARMLGE